MSPSPPPFSAVRVSAQRQANFRLTDISFNRVNAMIKLPVVDSKHQSPQLVLPADHGNWRLFDFKTGFQKLLSNGPDKGVAKGLR